MGDGNGVLTGNLTGVGIRGTAAAVRRASRSPYAGVERLRPPLIVHASHHKVGTVWFENVLGTVSRQHRLRFREMAGSGPVPEGTHVAFYPHASNVPWETLDRRRTRVSHMVRDPRDMAVSAYFYHCRSEEEWLHRPLAHLGGRSYQEHLRSLPTPAGLSEEIRRMALNQLPDLLGWDYGRPGVLELRYEDVIADEEAAFRALFAHYGFHPDAAADAVATALTFSLSQRKGGAGPGHARSGRPGEWREVFQDEHVALFKELLGGALVQLGYESSDAWSL